MRDKQLQHCMPQRVAGAGARRCMQCNAAILVPYRRVNLNIQVMHSYSSAALSSAAEHLNMIDEEMHTCWSSAEYFTFTIIV